MGPYRRDAAADEQIRGFREPGKDRPLNGHIESDDPGNDEPRVATHADPRTGRDTAPHGEHGGSGIMPDPAHTTTPGRAGDLADTSESRYGADPLCATAGDAAADHHSGERPDRMVHPREPDTPGAGDAAPRPGSGPANDHQDVERAGGGGTPDFERRWREVQAGFVDDPRGAVRRADRLVEHAVEFLAARRQGLADRWKNGEQGDTERLRLALREYRSLLNDLVGLSYPAAGRGAPADQERR